MSRRGYSLIEVLVALTVLGIGVAGTAATANLAFRVLARAGAEETAVRLGAEVLDSLLQSPEPVPGQSVLRGFTVAWSSELVGSVRVVEVAVRSRIPTAPAWTIAGVHFHPPSLDGDEP